MTLTVGGVEHAYQVYTPPGWDPKKKWPVVLFLHGAGERGTDGDLQTRIGLGQALRSHPADFPAVVVMPQCPADKFWTDSDMQELALAELAQGVAAFNGDESRTYLTGLSMGGYGSWSLAANNPGKFAAVGVVCGGIRAPPNNPSLVGLHSGFVGDPTIHDPYAETARRIGNTPVYIFHGDIDSIVPVEESRQMNRALAGNANAHYVEYHLIDHNAWDAAYSDREFARWLFAQKRQP